MHSKSKLPIVIAGLLLGAALSGCANATTDNESAESITVPDVLGVHPDTAGATLNHLDLNPVIRVDANSFDPQQLEVYATDPMPGNTVEPGESVWVCALPLGEGGGDTGECPLLISPVDDPEVEEQFDKVDEANEE